jgi:DEAD/DEAH box helicase domain-containing protein
MPFRRALGTSEPFPEVPLGFHPFRHQELAFQRLRGDAPKSTMIATGTGSGKTESFLWPILDNCRRRKGEPGIKAILIYPMNALATDQAKRIAKAIHRNASLQGVRCGIYADAEPKAPSDEMGENEVITRREAMRVNPPDILLTNYKMLDYLLLRGRDRPLWSQNSPASLRFLVVDEMHSFDGAQGADLALLIRRLKARLGTPERHLACIGSSATLGTGEEAARQLIAYAENIFGEAFEEGSVVREDRMGPSEVLRPPEYLDLPDPAKIQDGLLRAETLSQPAAALELARCFFPDLDPQSREFDPSLPADPATPEWRIALGNALLEHVAAQRVLTLIAESRGPASLEVIVDGFSKSKVFRAWREGDLRSLAEAVVSLVAWAREGTPAQPRPRLNVRIQFWARELVRMVADLPGAPDGSTPSDISLFHSDDLSPSARRRALPIVHCGRCGMGGYLGRRGQANGDLWSPIETLYEEFFGTSQRLRIIYRERVSRVHGETRTGSLVSGFLDAVNLRFTQGDHSGDVDAGSQTPVWLYDPTDQNGRIDRTCPACGTLQSLQIFGLRAARLTAALANTLYNSNQNEENDQDKPRLLLFSDSVQDAAQRAAVAEIRNTATVVRKSLYQAIQASTTSDLSLKTLIEDVPQALCDELGSETFAARFIARDQVWREQYQLLGKSGQLLDADRFLDHIRLRLGWEYFSDLTYRSHTSQTLEAARLALADVSPSLIRTVAERLPEALEAHVSPNMRIEVPTAVMFLSGLLQHVRRRGAVGHNYLRRAMEKYAKGRGPNYFAAARILRVGKTGALPIPNHRRAAAPMPPTLRSNLEGYESILRDHGTNWYRDWADRFFLPVYAFAPSSYPEMFQKVFELLEAQSIVRRVVSEENEAHYAYVIEPEAVLVSDQVVRLRCDYCRREEVAFAASRNSAGSPCTRIGCAGSLWEDEDGRDYTHMHGLMTSARNHRVVAREHTGILNSDDRRELEIQFITSDQPWAPNLISATPTLEMGIDIGDLSTLLLCSVPPETANYVQRIGRSGRRDGNSFNLTLANARRHDLQFWEEPDNMLQGEVGAPGVHLEAIAVLRRQVAAFTLDRLVAVTESAGTYGQVRSVLKTLEGESSGFPLDWFQFIEGQGAELASAFLALLPGQVRDHPHIVKCIERYLTGGDDETLIWQIQAAFADVRREKDDLQRLLKELDQQQRKLRRQTPPPTDLDKKIDEIRRDKGEIRHSIRVGIDEVDVLRFLTDRGMLPNYAFPEEGVKLKSILARQREGLRPGEKVEGSNLTTREYIRPATAALSELAPWQTFYADGREVKIDRLDLSARDLSDWRFCQKCAHVEKELNAKGREVCPKCGDEMWSDAGSVHSAIELKTVIAVTAEQNASIRDSDDRQNQKYDRAMFPSYTENAVEQAWASVNRSHTTPFGYEFISTCEFRDVNFGEKTAAPIGAIIAGEPRNSRPFLVCRHCGRLQKQPIDDEDPGVHLPRCIAQQDEQLREDWEATIFLMRHFKTEAIRVVIPVIGEADYNDIKSFVAGIELGMRKHFAGKVDHIRNVVVEEQIEGQFEVRSLYLYDSVPGGSGYLRQLAEHPETLKSVVEKAVTALRDCRCVGEHSDGCFRCVRSYRSQFGPGEPSRDTALVLMESVLQHWDNLKKVDAGLNNSIRNDLVDSVLERRFLDALRRTFGPESVKPKLIEGARRAFQLNAGGDGKASFWTMETQVQIERRYSGLPRKRVDFLFSPASGQKSLPIVVEMDGLAFHAETAGEDLLARLLMIRTRKVRVWSLAWHDLSTDDQGAVPNPFSIARMGGAFEGILSRTLASPAFLDLNDHRKAITLLHSGTSFDGLIACLRSNIMRYDQAAIVIGRLAIGNSAKSLADLPRISGVSEDGQLFLEEKPLHGYLGDQNLDLYLAAPDTPPPEALRDIEGYRVLLKGALPKLNGDIPQTQGLSDAWRGLWRMMNYLQDLPGFHLEFEGMTGAGTPVISAEPREAEVEAWTEVDALVDEGFADIVEALKAAGVPPPDLVGWDALQGDTVVGMVEIGWSPARVGLVEVPFELPGWHIIVVDTRQRGSNMDLIGMILSSIERTTA